MRRKAEVFNTDAHPVDTATDVLARLEAEKDAWQRRMQTLHDEQERFQIENPDQPVQSAHTAQDGQAHIVTRSRPHNHDAGADSCTQGGQRS
jgi:hypothetical protein